MLEAAASVARGVVLVCEVLLVVVVVVVFVVAAVVAGVGELDFDVPALASWSVSS